MLSVFAKSTCCAITTVLGGFLKKILFVAVLLLLCQYRDQLFSFESAGPEVAAQYQEKVVLYATSWCAYCRKTRKFLSEKNIPYREIDIENSSEGYQQFKNLGGRGVPLILVNGRVIKGYDTKRIMEYL